MLDAISEPLIVRDGTLAAWGYGVSIGVSNGHLIVTDGFADERRTIRLSRADRPKRIVVVVEAGGYVSLDAVKWLTNTGSSSLIMLDRKGVVLSAIGPRRLDDARLRRAQAIAPWSGADIALARYLLASKVEGQSAVIGREALSSHRDAIMQANDLASMLVAESAAAVAYWAALAPMPVRFARSSSDRVPNAWKTMGQRMSPIGRGNRHAVTIGNALLNFCYAIVEAEVTIALATVGLDPGLGVIHTDVENRPSFTLDVLEALRPNVDRFVLDLILRRSFTHNDAVERPTGEVRLSPVFATEIARSTTFAASIAFVVSQAVSIIEGFALPIRPALGSSMGPSNVMALAEGRKVTTIRQRRSTSLRVSTSKKVPRNRARVSHTCHLCGVNVDRKRAPFVCAPCRPKHDETMKADRKARIEIAGRAAFARAHAAGKHPHLAPEVMERKRISQARSARAKYAWIDDGTLDHIDFERDVLPRIADIPISRLAHAMDVSRSWAALMRSGKRPTHKRHWAALIAIAGLDSE